MDDIKRILPDEFDSAIIGTVNQSMIPVYSMTKTIKALIKHHQMDFFEAKEHLEMKIAPMFDIASNGSILVDDLHFVM